MPFIPHTQADVDDMLAEIGVPDIDSLFDEIPNELTSDRLDHVPEGMSELAMLQHMAERAEQDQGYTCFLGGGSYDHHIPSAVWDLTTRGEFMTAYTPYQAEASQGTLQLIYEYQSMMVALTGMDVSNASVYDGASGLAEAVLMAIRANKKNKSGRVLIAQTVHPHYTQTTRNIVQNQNVVIEALPLGEGGVLDMSALASIAADGNTPGAIVIQQPNFFGRMEDVDALTNWAHQQNTLVIAVVNPMSLGVLKPPSEWGEKGADIVCGDGQPFGVPMASGGPSFGFICSRKEFMRQLPGRIIGKTEDLDGRTGYALTLQAREQHIRRGKATSNICTNQGLLVTAGTIYMSLMGPQGIRETALTCHRRAVELQQRLLQIDGVEEFFTGPFFHEFALRLPIPAVQVVEAMMAEGVLPGLVLSDFSDGNLDHAEHGLLVAVTEKRTNAEIEKYVALLTQVLQANAGSNNAQAGS
ncbi:MAG: aminomethyl-transferring glycine dehydrogenase subunit GcvPA [Gammaproteobacteria bacterium]|jgi:glycine dehydrogenase subunit 1|nr:aminomethyl-transferring glycine dehydrogenase subunit GcvPA [Gammaproteobacteria bacterium]MBT5332771.1 aminomethyl-transferring glycine dehydrogenase subunit GcvPA [Gammaproteobacteria bacterium]MBT5682767.1 aminomethyl-transferring glycine dehydrogenase subunit GcvPA [Gammaproteobacteria bacterium]MBT6557079.1 aminomethyl-transferring glycine dehydrogenase subunit GcvPA [Gammaproteobacteria bacterium]